MVEVAHSLAGTARRIAKPLVVVGIPACNEERSIARVVLEAQKYAEVVVVCDDGSTDLTGKIAEKLGVVVVRHTENLGYGAAIQSLFEEARRFDADVFVTVDGDGQHDADLIPQLIKPILEGKADLATGSRFSGAAKVGNAGLAWYRRVGIQTITKLANSASRRKVTDAQNGFRAYGKAALERLRLNEDGMGVSVELLVKAEEEGLRLAEVPIRCNYLGVEKPSSHHPVRHGVSVVSSLVKLVVERRPLTFLGVPGVISLAVGVFFGVWMLQTYAATRQIVTNIALASIAFVMIGFFALSAAITLYAISRLAEKNRHEK